MVEDGEEHNEAVPTEPVSDELKQAIVARAEAASSGSSEAATRALTDPFDVQRHTRQKLDMELREKYAKWFLWGLGMQLGVADVVFVLYAWVGEHWTIPAVAISAWTGALVVEVIGVVLVITNGLFPKDDKPDYSPPH